MKENSDKSVSESKNSRFAAKRKPGKFSLTVFVVFFAVVASYLTYNSFASTTDESRNGGAQSSAAKVPNLSLSPASQKVGLSSPMSVQVWANSGEQTVNAVQVNLSYPLDKLNFVNVDTNKSAFGLAVEADGGNGKVTIARGSFDDLKGKLLIATINFTGAASKGKATVDFADGSALSSATTNKDVLADTYGGTYTLSQ